MHSYRNRCQKKSEKKWEVFTHGGRNSTGLDVLDYAKEVEESGAGEILLTSMDRDGTKKGYDLELTELVSNSVNIPVIASGGVGKLDHLYEELMWDHRDKLEFAIEGNHITIRNRSREGR